MNKLPLDIKHINAAKSYYKDLKKEAGENHKAESICGGAADLAAFVGEEVITDALSAENISTERGTNKFNFDLFFRDWKFDVKLKRRTVDPKPYHDASVAETSLHQKCDGYLFLSMTFGRSNGKSGPDAVYYDPQSLWFCGFKPKQEYLAQAKHWKKGDVDPSNGWEVLSSCYNVPYKDLFTYDQLLKLPVNPARAIQDDNEFINSYF